MNNKYYIPSIEEFCVGFEYQELVIVPTYNPKWGFKLKTSIFTDKHMTNIYLAYNFTEDLKEGKIRAKYLDREDIESCGFVCTKDTGRGFGFQRLLDNYALYTISMDIFDGIPTLSIEFEKPEYVATLFTGYIKNKSDFKRLLHQLKIG